MITQITICLIFRTYTMRTENIMKAFMEMDKLEDKLQPKMALQVKRQMGLEFNNWKKLPKMKI